MKNYDSRSLGRSIFPSVTLTPYKFHFSLQDPTNGYYKVRGASVSPSIGEDAGEGNFLPPPTPSGPPGTPTYPDFNPQLAMTNLQRQHQPGPNFLPPRNPVPPCRPYRDRTSYLTTSRLVPQCRPYRDPAGSLTLPRPRDFTNYIKPTTSFGLPDLTPGPPSCPYTAFPTPSHSRLQTHV